MKLATQHALQLRLALGALDGFDRAVEISGKTVLVRKPFKFAGRTRLKIARNLRELERAHEDYEVARVGLVRELSDGADAVPVEKLAIFHRQHAALLREAQELPLATLGEEELNLDENEIPHGVAALLLQFLAERAEANSSKDGPQ